MAELALSDKPQVKEYTGTVGIIAERKLKIQLSGADIAQEIVFEQTCPEGQTWIAQIAVNLIVSNG